MKTSGGPDLRRCAANTVSGKPCQMSPLRRKPYCWTHSPDLIAKREAARQLGGRNRRRRTTTAAEIVSLKEIGDVKALLERAIADTLVLDNSPRRSRVLVSAVLTAIKVLEVEATQQQIEEAKAQFGL